VWELWVWIQFTGLTLPLRVTPMNNPITLISPVQSLGYIFLLQLTVCVRSANFRIVFSESQNDNPLDAEPEPDFNAKWLFNVVQSHPLRCQWRASKRIHSTIQWYIVQYNNCGTECEGSEDIASEISENRHLRRPNSHLTPPLQQTPANIYINLTLLETRIHGLHFCCW